MWTLFFIILVLLLGSVLGLISGIRKKDKSVIFSSAFILLGTLIYVGMLFLAVISISSAPELEW